MSGWQQWCPARIGDAAQVEDLRHVVRVHAVDVEGDDAGAPLRRRPVEAHAGDLAEPLERVRGELLLVVLDRVQADVARGSRWRAPSPTASPIGGVPASNLCGRSPQVVSSNRTVRIMCAAEVERLHRLEQLAPAPERRRRRSGRTACAPRSARKSQPSACTSIARCGTACAASTTMIAPCSCAHAASRSTGLIVPSEFETRLFATTLTLPVLRESRRAPSRSSSPLSVRRIIRSSAPVRRAMCCQGTKLEWCSSSVTTTMSPGPRFVSPHAYATRLMPSVALRVKMTSRRAGALTNARAFSRAASNAAVARSASS